MSTKSSYKEKTDNKLREPKQFHVIMLNDDFTTMDFVVRILIEIFHKDKVTAETLMMKVHKEGRAVVGTYPYDIAVTKSNAAMEQARNEGFPFRLTVEEV